MIEQSIYEHLADALGGSGLAQYGGKPAVFSQNAPADTDPAWAAGPQFPRLVFAVDWEHSADRSLGGTMAVDIVCQEQGVPPDALEKLIRELLHGWFFTDNGETVAAQWVNSNYFTEPVNKVAGVTMTFALLGFPLMTIAPDVIGRINAWTAEQFPALPVINATELPAAWKPDEHSAAVYWRIVSTAPATWIPETWQTIYQTTVLRAHLFAATVADVTDWAQRLVVALYGAKRLKQEHAAPILVNTSNTIDPSADALRTGQVTVDATYGIIVQRQSDNMLWHIHVDNSEV